MEPPDRIFINLHWDEKHYWLALESNGNAHVLCVTDITTKVQTELQILFRSPLHTIAPSGPEIEHHTQKLREALEPEFSASFRVTPKIFEELLRFQPQEQFLNHPRFLEIKADLETSLGPCFENLISGKIQLSSEINFPDGKTPPDPINTQELLYSISDTILLDNNQTFWAFIPDGGVHLILQTFMPVEDQSLYQIYSALQKDSYHVQQVQTDGSRQKFRWILTY